MKPELLLLHPSSRPFSIVLRRMNKELTTTTRDRISIAFARLVVPYESKKLNTII